jgi:hypothetical protein
LPSKLSFDAWDFSIYWCYCDDKPLLALAVKFLSISLWLNHLVLPSDLVREEVSYIFNSDKVTSLSRVEWNVIASLNFELKRFVHLPSESSLWYFLSWPGLH